MTANRLKYINHCCNELNLPSFRIILSQVKIVELKNNNNNIKKTFVLGETIQRCQNMLTDKSYKDHAYKEKTK